MWSCLPSNRSRLRDTDFSPREAGQRRDELSSVAALPWLRPGVVVDHRDDGRLELLPAVRLLRGRVEAVTTRTGIHPLRVYRRNEELGCTVVSLYGFRARHRDGWFGPPRHTVAAARTDLRDHERELHGQAVE